MKIENEENKENNFIVVSSSVESFISGYSKAKILKHFPLLDQEIKYYSVFSNEGFDYYRNFLNQNIVFSDKNKITDETGILSGTYINKIFTNEEFEKEYNEQIESYFNNVKDSIKTNLIRSNSKLLNELKDFIEINEINKNTKYISPFYNIKFMNKYYIYNAGIHQIIKFKKGFKSFRLIIQKPSGKLTELTISEESFNCRKLFDLKKEAEKYLIDKWILKNEIPKYREKYINTLKTKGNK